MKDEQKFTPGESHESEAAEKLEQYFQAQFKRLPEIEAPPTLMPRVFAAIRAKEQLSWWRRPWFSWPAAWQILSLTFLVALPVFIFYASHWAWDQFQPNPVPESVSGSIAFIRALADVAAGLGNALLIILRSLEQPWVLACTGLLAVMYLTCIGLGTACVRVAIGKTPLNVKFK